MATTIELVAPAPSERASRSVARGVLGVRSAAVAEALLGIVLLARFAAVEPAVRDSRDPVRVLILSHILWLGPLLVGLALVALLLVGIALIGLDHHIRRLGVEAQITWRRGQVGLLAGGILLSAQDGLLETLAWVAITLSTLLLLRPYLGAVDRGSLHLWAVAAVATGLVRGLLPGLLTAGRLLVITELVGLFAAAVLLWWLGEHLTRAGAGLEARLPPDPSALLIPEDCSA